MKICSKCGESKSFSEFNKKQGNKDGLRSECRKCTHIINKEWRKSHPEYNKFNKKRWRTNNPKKSKESSRIYSRGWRERNPEKLKEYYITWCKTHNEQQKEKNRIKSRKIRSTIKGKLNSNLSREIRKSLTKGSKRNHHWESLVSFTVNQLKTHLEKLFKPGMTWENYGTVWEIDHKVPIAVFNFKKPDDIDFRLCWNLKNLQPLGITENRKKSAKLFEFFQPLLSIRAKA